jgi:EAL domain-containing protein (putative c-di-GMP-specific phosphodiesterase class I)
VLDEALRQGRQWSDAGHELSVAVNVSARRLLDLGFPDEVAEGVENALTLQQLGLLGCHAVQGFHISRPIAPDDLTSWLEQTATPTPEPISDSRGPTRIPRQL